MHLVGSDCWRDDPHLEVLGNQETVMRLRIFTIFKFFFTPYCPLREQEQLFVSAGYV